MASSSKIIPQIKRGIILVEHTCSAINPITLKEYNKHDEHIKVVSVNGNYVSLYNLESRRSFIMSLWDLKDCIKNRIYTIVERK